MSRGTVPPPSASDLPGRFRRDLTAALGAPLGAGDRLALAVSGGPDSMAMLWLAARALPGQVVAATVDHRLRAGSAGEAATVARWCAAEAIPHRTLTAEARGESGGNLHDWARQQRYRLLGSWAAEQGACALATAHHADDQAETFLMRAARGCGLAGLAGVRRRGPVPGDRADGAPPVVRPLLGWRRQALRALCDEHRLPFVDDPGNADPRFARARLREGLATAPWLDVEGVARTAANLAAVDAELRAATDWLWTERQRGDDPAAARLAIAGLPRELRRRLVRIALARVTAAAGGDGARFADANVESLLDALEAGEQAMKGEVLARPEGDLWHFRLAPPRRAH